MNNNNTSGKFKHPFNIICRKCGRNNVSIYAFDYDDIEIRCLECGKTIECREYHTMKGDYSDS